MVVREFSKNYNSYAKSSRYNQKNAVLVTSSMLKA